MKTEIDAKCQCLCLIWFPLIHYNNVFLLSSSGKNDGSVAGKHYFHCNPGYGVLVKPDRVSRGGTKRRRQQQQQKRRSANLSGSTPNLAALTALAKGEGGGLTASRKGENRKSWNNWDMVGFVALRFAPFTEKRLHHSTHPTVIHTAQKSGVIIERELTKKLPAYLDRFSSISSIKMGMYHLILRLKEL